MADLNPRGGGRMAELDDRAQVMLVTGFLLAASFVALALVLNSVIYTENIATRTEEARGADAIAYKVDTVEGAEELIEYANANGTTLTDIEADFNSSLRAMSNRTAAQFAVDGTYVRTYLKSTDAGTRIGQFNATGRNFTNADASPDENWELADDVTNTRSFHVNITDSSALIEDGSIPFLDPTGTEEPFTIVVDGSTSDQRFRIYRDDDGSITGGDTVLDFDGGGECYGGLDPTIDLTAGTFDGEPCDALDFADGVGTPYDIEFEDSAEVIGNFSLVVDSGATIDSTNYDSDQGTPFNTPAIYEATLFVSYESANMIYETDATATPGESND